MRVSGFAVWGLGFGQECSGLLPGLGLGDEGIVGPLMQPALPLKGCYRVPVCKTYYKVTFWVPKGVLFRLPLKGPGSSRSSGSGLSCPASSLVYLHNLQCNFRLWALGFVSLRRQRVCRAVKASASSIEITGKFT